MAKEEYESNEQYERRMMNKEKSDHEKRIEGRDFSTLEVEFAALCASAEDIDHSDNRAKAAWIEHARRLIVDCLIMARLRTLSPFGKLVNAEWRKHREHSLLAMRQSRGLLADFYPFITSGSLRAADTDASHAAMLTLVSILQNAANTGATNEEIGAMFRETIGQEDFVTSVEAWQKAKKST